MIFSRDKTMTDEVIKPLFKQVVLLVTGIAILILGVAFYLSFKSEKQSTIERTKILIDSIGSSLLNSLGTGDHIEVARLMNGIISLSSIKGVYIINQDGEFEFAYPEKDFTFKKLQNLDLPNSFASVQTSDDRNYIIDTTNNKLVIYKQLSHREAPVQWNIAIIYSLAGIQKSVSFRLVKFLCIIFVLIIILMVLMKFLFNLKLKSVSYVLEQVNLISKGNYELSDIPLPPKGKLQNFVQAFNEMRKSIISSRREIENNTNLIAIGRSTAMVAHDVRRPLASVKALLNVLPSIQNDPDRVKKMAAEVDRAITSTNSLLNDIMDFSKDSTALELDDHSPDSVIIAAIGDALRGHPEAEVKLEYDFLHELRPMHADSQRMIRVLTNIIGNALEAMVDKTTGKACGNLFFKTYLAKRDGKEFVGISVADDGPGIPEEALSKLFDPFFTQGKKGGTGLGLAICHKVIDMHGGRISAKNRDDTHGAEFVIEVPAGEGRYGMNHADIIDHSSELKLFREEEAKREDIGDTASTVEFMRINKERGRISTLLIVDDEPLFRETIRSTLNTLGQVKDHVKVIEADSAETGLKLFELQALDYVIADIDLGRGRMNGYTFAQKILLEHPSTHVLIHSNKRKAELDEKIRVMACAPSPRPSPSPARQRISGGRGEDEGGGGTRFMGFLPKPMKPSELLQFLACKSFEQVSPSPRPSPLEGEGGRRPGEGNLPVCKPANLKTALLLNDDEGLLMCFGDDLKKLGYQVLDAKNVSGAMEHLLNRKIDMIVSDINLGDCEPTGYDFLNKVREKDTKVPFVFTSGYNRRDEWDKAKGAGATEYLQIPYELHELKKALGA